jgi:acetyl-CoA carboxylase biotin carboxylase subunit
MEALGNKTAARKLVQPCGVPVVPGTLDALPSAEEARRIADEIGYPVMLKAAAGGGGKGMRLIHSADEVASAFSLAQTEALNAFGDGSLFLEKAILRPRHIEIQILADHHGNVVWLGERECSVQRRHQKIIEESPSPVLKESIRQAMGAAAVTAVRAAQYANAGTVEFLLDADQNFYFLEVNTRLQVEHPVTELVTGLDLVVEQIRVAAGLPLRFRQEEIVPRGHAIECRIYAEDAANNFMPSPGTIRRLVCPMGPGLREDSGVYEGWTVPMDYDPMLSKLIAWGEDRAQAIARLRRALDEYELMGIRHNLDFFRRVLRDPDFQQGRFDTGYVARLQARPEPPLPDDLYRDAAIAVAIAEVTRTTTARPDSSQPGADGRPSAWRQAVWQKGRG